MKEINEHSVRPQPSPEANQGKAIWNLVIQDTDNMRFFPIPHENDKGQIIKASIKDSILDSIILDMHDRNAFGIEKYKTPLQAFNGRNPFVDLYQELLDAAAYTKQALQENTQQNKVQTITNTYYEILKNVYLIKEFILNKTN